MSQQPTNVTGLRRPSAGMLLAIALLLCSGAGYRALDAWYGRSPTSATIPEGALDRLPYQIGDWTGQDQELDEIIIEQTDTDAHVNRLYEKRWGWGNVSLWIAYGIRLRDLAPHRPEVCYSGAGWLLDSTRSLEITADDGTKVPCRMMQFKRGALATERVTLLNYFIVDGQYSEDVEQLRGRAMFGRAHGTTYAAQVQIATNTAMQHSRGDELVQEFGTASANAIATVLREAVEMHTAQSTDAN